MTLEDLAQDFRFALRQLGRAPAFAIGIVITLALGIGANATMAGAIDRLLMRSPPHVRDAQSLTALMYHAPGSEHYNPSSNYPSYLALREDVPAFSGVAAFRNTKMSLGEGADAEYVDAVGVTGYYFSLLGVSPFRGRLINRADDSLATPAKVVVISDGLWRRRFAADPAIIGGQLVLGVSSYTVIGIAPPGFEGVRSPSADVWLPLSAAVPEEGWLRAGWHSNFGSFWLQIVARLDPGTTLAQAESQTNTAMRRLALDRGRPDRVTPMVLSSVIQGRALDRPREVRVSFWLSGVSVLVLLIACINVANLLLTRTMLRRREVALRAALGASTGRLLRQFFIESFVLASTAGIVALAVVAIMGRAFKTFVFTASDGSFVDARLLSLGAVITLLAALLISLAPWVQLRAHDLVSALQQRAGATAPRHRVQTVLLGVQALVAVILLIGAGLFGRSLERVRSLDLGVDLDHTLVATVDLRRLGLQRPEHNALYDEFVRRVRELPSVEDATIATTNPYMGGTGASPWIPGSSQQETWEGKGEVAYSTSVGPRFFAITGASSLRGRDFADSDRKGAEPVVIINKPLEKRLFGGGTSALNKCVMVDEKICARVIGVLSGVFKFNVLDREKMTLFYPFEQEPFRPPLAGMIVARARANTGVAMNDVRRAIQSARPDLPAARVQSMREFADPQFLPWRIGATMFLLFGAVALILAGAGLYSVALYSVTQRSREFAVRIALGAGATHVARAAVQGELVVILAGVITGSVAALSVAKWSGPLLYQTSPKDPWIIVAAAGALALVAALAVVIPVRRALRLDPAALMRLEQ